MRRLPLLMLTFLGALVTAPPAPAERVPTCTFDAGALPARTMPHRPHGAAIPIDQIIVLMQENRSFDHYFGQLHYQGQRRAGAVPMDASNPDPTDASAPPLGIFHKTKYCESADLYDHTSILRFIETRFDLPALTRRDANADPMLKLFRFRRPSFPTPPTLPAAVIDQSQQQPECVNGANGT